MSTKPCSLCGRAADISVLVLISTLRIAPRHQHSAPSIPLCNACLSVSATSARPEVQARLTNALTTACSALTRHSDEQSNSPKGFFGNCTPQPIPAGPTTAAEVAAGCRPCLIACNSRQYDEREKE
jgi:hypothetical protein